MGKYKERAVAIMEQFDLYKTDIDEQFDLILTLGNMCNKMNTQRWRNSWKQCPPLYRHI